MSSDTPTKITNKSKQKVVNLWQRNNMHQNNFMFCLILKIYVGFNLKYKYQDSKAPPSLIIGIRSLVFPKAKVLPLNSLTFVQPSSKRKIGGGTLIAKEMVEVLRLKYFFFWVKHSA